MQHGATDATMCVSTQASQAFNDNNYSYSSQYWQKNVNGIAQAVNKRESILKDSSK